MFYSLNSATVLNYPYWNFNDINWQPAPLQ